MLQTDHVYSQKSINFHKYIVSCLSIFVLISEEHLKHIFNSSIKLCNNIKNSNVINANVNPNRGAVNARIVIVRYLNVNRLKIFDRMIVNIYIANL